MNFESPKIGKERLIPLPVLVVQASLLVTDWVLLIENTQDQLTMQDILFYNRSGGSADLYIAIVPFDGTFDDGLGVDQDGVFRIMDGAIAADTSLEVGAVNISIPIGYSLYAKSSQDANIHITGLRLTT